MKPTPAPQAKKRTKEKQNLKKKNIGQVSTREREREDGISVKRTPTPQAKRRTQEKTKPDKKKYWISGYLNTIGYCSGTERRFFWEQVDTSDHSFLTEFNNAIL